MPMPPRPSSRRKRYLLYFARSGGRSLGGVEAADAFSTPGASPDRAGREEALGLAARTLPRKESGGRLATVSRQAGQDSRWAAIAAAARSGSLPRPKAASSWIVG